MLYATGADPEIFLGKEGCQNIMTLRPNSFQKAGRGGNGWGCV